MMQQQKRHMTIANNDNSQYKNLKIQCSGLLLFINLILSSQSRSVKRLKIIRQEHCSPNFLKITVMQIEKVLINDRLRVSKVPEKFRIPTIYNFCSNLPVEFAIFL